MYRMIPAILFCGVFALLVGSGCSGDAAPADIKLDKSSVDVLQGASADVKVTAGKPEKADVPAEAKGLTATTAADKVSIKAAADAADGDFTVKVKGAKGTADLKVTVKKK